MPRKNWNGRRVTNAVAWVITRDNGICWLCGHTGANSCDHILPASQYPHLEWDRHNWKAAHLHKAHTPGGCTHPQCQCPGNKGRGTQPHTQPTTRTW